MSTTSETAPVQPADAQPAAAIILAGGRASRLGGAAKPLLEVGGRTLLDRAVVALADCEPVIVVGPRMPVGGEVVWTRETPAFSGPVAAIAAGLALIDSAEVYILAADLPNAEASVALLRQHPPLSENQDGVCLTDATGRMQWLTARYRVDALRGAVKGLTDAGRDASARSLLGGLAISTVSAGDLATDVDTWDDLERARAMAQGRDPRDDAPEETP